MQESELLNHLLNIEGFTLNLGNDCRNIEFVSYIGSVKRGSCDSKYSAHYVLKIYQDALANQCIGCPLANHSIGCCFDSCFAAISTRLLNFNYYG